MPRKIVEKRYKSKSRNILCPKWESPKLWMFHWNMSLMCQCLFLSTLHPGILSAEPGTVTSWIRMTSVTSDPSILCSDCRSKHVWQLELVDLCKCPVGRADKTAGFGDAWGEWGGNGSVGWVGWAPTLQIPQLNALLSKQRHTLETTIIAIMILGTNEMQSILSICVCFDCEVPIIWCKGAI